MRKKVTINRSTGDVPAFSQDEIKNEGKVYTPDVVTQDIVSRFQYFTDPNRIVADPSCGQGNLLRIVFQQRLQKTKSIDEAFENILGFELDPVGVNNAHTYFIEQGVSKTLVERNIIQCNTLERYTKYIETVHDVIGNPPFVRSPGNLPSTITMNDNLVDAFFQVGMEILKSGNDHHLVYIVQDSFITNEISPLREYFQQFNIKTLEHRFDYSQAFRKHDIAVDIALVELTKGLQQPFIDVRRHIPFKMPATSFKAKDKWLIYPESINALATKIGSVGVPLSTLCTIKKGRTVNQKSAVPSSYGSLTFSKKKTKEFNVPVLAEPNTDYYFPLNTELVVYGKAVDKTSNEEFKPFIILPYFTSKFRFCLIEKDLLTTPLLYTLSGPNVKSLLPIINSSAVDFLIRYFTKSRDTGYEFKSSTFDNIVIPTLDAKMIKQMEKLVEHVRTGKITKEECDQYVMTNVYKLSTEEQLLIQQCKIFWFKKNVKTLLADQEFCQTIIASL
jgi:hypothetical protein